MAKVPAALPSEEIDGGGVDADRTSSKVQGA
jgi:hypothetical protein